MYIILDMVNPAIAFDTLSALINSTSLHIFETIMKEGSISFTNIKTSTGLSNDTISRHLNKLLEYSLIKIDVTKSSDGKFAFYLLTNQGKETYQILYETMTKFDDVKTLDYTKKFVIDAKNLNQLINRRSINWVKHVFNQSEIILSPSEYKKISYPLQEIENKELERFLENNITISRTYKKPEDSVKVEYYLRRAKKMDAENAKAIAIALDAKAAIISDEEKIIQYAHNLGAKSIHIESVLELKRNELIFEKLNDINNTSNKEPQFDFLLHKRPVKTLKKNYDKY